MAIFVNYRREDTLAITGRIDDHLRHAFGAGDVYRDIDSIPPGTDFVEHVRAALYHCDVCITIIGSAWASPRLSDPEDFVRLELETVLTRQIPVIPVLVERARLPDRNALPPSLHPLLRRQAMAIDSGGDFKEHVQDLVRAIAQLRAVRASVARQPEGAVGAGPSRRQLPAGHTLGSVLLATARGALLLVSIGCALFVVVMLIMLVSHEEGTTPSEMLSGGAVFTILGCSAFALNRRLSRLGTKDPGPHAAG